MEDYPIEITNGVRINRHDIPAKHEEADLIIVQQAIMETKSNKTVSVISDDTDVFVLLLHFYVSNNCTEHMYMSSPRHKSIKVLDLPSPQLSNQEERTIIDIKQIAQKHSNLSEHIL